LVRRLLAVAIDVQNSRLPFTAKGEDLLDYFRIFGQFLQLRVICLGWARTAECLLATLSGRSI